MCDSIPINIDQMLEDNIRRGQECYLALAKTRGVHRITILVLNSQPQKTYHFKHPIEEQKNGKVLKKRSSQTLRM